MADRAARAAGFTWHGFRAGIAAAPPLAANSAVGGIIFGALAAQLGLGFAAATAMSALVYAGGAQVASLQIWGNPLSLVAVWATTLAINARYILLSASLRPWLAGAAGPRLYGTLFTLSDGGWALALRRWRGEPVDAGFLLGIGLTQYVPWIAGTVAGHALGNLIGSPKVYGLDFMVPAFFAAMAAGLWQRRNDLGPIAVAAAAALLADRVVPGQWSLLIGAFAGSLVGIVTHAGKR